jgi:hypothetical protein
MQKSLASCDQLSYSTYIDTATPENEMNVYFTPKGFGRVVSVRGVYKVYRLENGVWKQLTKLTSLDCETAIYDCKLCAK